MATRSRSSPNIPAFRPREPRKAAPSSKRSPSLFLNSPDPTALFDGDGRLFMVNDAALNEGSPWPTAGDPPLPALLPFWTDVASRVRLLHEAAAPDGANNLEVRVPAKGDAPERIFWLTARACREAGEGRFIAVAREVTDKTGELERLKSLYNELAERSDRDPLTGFLNREHFRFDLDREIARADRLGTPLALIIFDLDDFKTLNDTHGLAAGDEYLRVLSETLRAAVRPGEPLARVGGDEIALVLPETPAGEAAVAAERLVSLVKRMTPLWEGHPLNLTVSAGVALYPEHAGGATDLVRAADLAMHESKKRGGARWLMHDPGNREQNRIGHLREQSNRIRLALSEGRFVPVFQPVSEIRTGRIVSVETLARMRETDGSLVAPDEFLDAAERFGYVTAIDRLLIAGAFDALVAGRRRVAPDLEMAINLSGLDFEDDHLVADISRLARSKGVPPGRVTFEITETAALRDFARVQSFTRALVAEGFRFALDDFGIGFSSFRYLKELPVSSLKLDISYVRNLATTPENRVFVRGMADICRGLDVTTIAEGVESAETLAILAELGVDRAQGHLIGFPSLELPATSAEDSGRRFHPAV
jgi:diguanylate cyclase (GGDEF)-like protein